MFGASFPFKIQKKDYIKNFEGGGLSGRKILYAEFIRVLFCAHDENNGDSSLHRFACFCALL